ncbi:MAG: DEAD/DEAH box helicase family protein [Paludibacteraceae bacterium]|nr:DEAD/DEAH box helicase family protein [Paludibacteraceae bacterium]
MPIKKYMLNVDGKDHQVSEKNIEKYGIESYAKNYPGATIRMRDDKDSDYDIPINEYQRAVDSGLKPFVTSYYKDEEEEITERSTFQPDSVVYMNQTSQPAKLDITQGKGSQSVPETIKTGTDSTTNVPEMNEMGTQVAVKSADSTQTQPVKSQNVPVADNSMLDAWEQQINREKFVPASKTVSKKDDTLGKDIQKTSDIPAAEWKKPATYQDYMNELVSEWEGTPHAYPETRSEQMQREASANASAADKIWNGELKGVVDGLIEQGREEGRAQIREYQKTVYGNGGIFSGAAGMGDQSHKEYAKATDAKKVIDGVQQYLAEKNGTQTGGEEGVTNPLQEQLMQKVYDYLVQKNTPKSTAEYIMRNVFSGSILGQLMSMGDGKSYEQRQIESGGLQHYQPSAGEEIGAMAASVATDLPVMAVTGAVGGVAGNALLNGATKRLMASGLSEAAARAIATRAAQQTGMKWALRTASEAVNFGTLEGLGSMVGQAYQTGDVDLGKAATAMAKGAATGAVMGVFGVSNDKFRGMMEGGLGETAGRALGYTTSLGGRTAILTGSSVFGQYLEDPNFDINNVDWTKEIAHAGLMNLGFDILGAVKRYQAYRKTGVRMRDVEKLNLTKEDIEQLNQAGINGKDAQEIAESILQVKDAKELKRDAPEGKGLVPSDFGFASQELGVSKEGSVLGQLLSNENIDLATKAKVAYLMTGMQFRLAPNTNVSDVQEQADGSFTVEKFNPSGQTNETRRFKTRQEAEKYRHDMQNEVMPNQVNVLEGMMDNAGKMNTATRIFDMVAKMYNTGKEQIAEAYAKGKRGEELTGREAQAFKTIDDLLNSIQSSEDYQFSTRQLKNRMDEAYGQKTGWMDNVLKKKYNSLNETERRAYDEYISNMKSILQGNQREHLQIGGEAESTVSESGITPLLENQTQETAMQMEPVNAPALPGSTISAPAVPVSSESAPSTTRTAARETGAALYTEHDPAKMRQAVVRQQVARERLRNSGMLDEAIDAIGEADDANREALLSNLDNEQRRLAEDYLQQNDVVDGMNEALTMAHLPEAEAAETLAQNMVSPHGKIVVVALGKNEDPTHKYGVVVNGIDATGNLVSPEGQIIVVPLEASEIANIDFSTFDDTKAISMRMEDAWGYVFQFESEYVMDSMLSAAQEDENILEGQTPIVPGQTVLLADTEGNTVSAQVVGGSRKNGWMVMEEGTNEPTAITEEELREMMLNAERIPIMQEYEAADKAYEREQREIHRQEERAAQKAKEAEEAARIAEEMKKPINRLAKYPEGHKNAGKPDYENSQPEDVRAYLVESLGLDGAVKSMRNMRTSLEKQVAEQSAKIETIRTEMEESDFFPDEAIAARELLAEEEMNLTEAQRKLDFWKVMERITAGPTQEEAQAAVTRSEAQQKAAKTKREVYKPSDDYRKMQKEFSDSETALSVLNDLEPHTPEELAAQLISGGVRLMKADEQVGDTTLKGVMSMTGYGQADLQRLNFVFATRANSGVSVSEFGEMLEQAAKDAGIRFSGKTQEEGANALLSLLGEVETIGDINRYVERNRMREAKKLYDEEANHFEDMHEMVVWDEYGMSYADYRKLQDAITSIVEIRAGFTQDFWESETYNEFISNFAANIADNGQEGNDNAGSPGGIAEVGDNVADGTGNLVEGNQETAESVRPVAEISTGREQGAQAPQGTAENRPADGNGNDVPVSTGQGTGSDEGRTSVSAEQIEQAKQLANEAIEEVKKEIQGRPVTVVGRLEDLSLYKERVGEEIFSKIEGGYNEPGSLASYVYEVDEIFVWANKAAKNGAGKQAMKAAVYHENIHSLIRGDRYTEEEFKSFANQIREAFPDIDDYVERAYASFPQSIKNEEVVTRYVEDLVDSRLEGLMLDGEGRIEGDTDAIGEELNHVINLLKDRKYERQGRNGRGQTLSVADRSENGQTAHRLQEDISSEKQESVHSMEEQGTVGTSEGVGVAGRKELYGSVPGNGSAGEGSEGQKLVPATGREGKEGNADTYVVEKRHHAKLDQDVWAVKFTERFDRDKFLELKKEVKKFRGYYSSYGKGGFIFEDEAHARKFAESVVGVEAPVASAIEQARAEVNTNPSEAQKEAGNYKMGHLKLDGYDITIENPKGSVRSGKDANGKEWRTTMNNDYGYIRGTKAVDGDHIDVFLSDKPEEGRVFVVDQTNQDGSFDESKVMYGFNSLEEAREAYLSNYDAGWESRIMAITEVSKEEFKKWIDSSTRKTKAFSEYKSVKSAEGNELKPTYDEQGRETIESQAGRSRGEAERLASEAESGSLEAASAAGRGSGTSGNRPAESAGGSRKPESVNGYRIGEKVLYKGKEVTIYEFENDGTPVLDTGMAPVIYEVGYWDNIEKLPTTVEQINRIAEAAKPSKKLERAERSRKKNQAKREKQKEQMVDLFSQVDAMEEKLVRQEQEIDAQLALLSEYKAGPKAQVREDMHTGAAKTLEKAGRKFAKALASRLGGHVDGKDISNGLTNIAPIGGDMVFRVWLDDADTQGVMMLINFDAAPDTQDFDKLVPKYGFWRMISDKDRSGVRNSNHNFYIENMNELESGSLMSRIADDMLSALNREAVKASNVTTEKRPKTTAERPETTEVLTNKKEEDGRNQGTDSGMGTEARQEAERTEPGRDDRGVHGNNVPDTQGSGRVSERDGEQQPSVNEPSPVAASVKRNTHNWSYGETHLELPTGEIGKLKGNIEAIRTLKELEASGQPATPEQKQALLKFVGWGGLAEALNSAEYADWQRKVKEAKRWGWSETGAATSWSKKWGKHYEDLRPLMTDEEWAAAQASTLNSHYTPETVIRGLWEALEYMGFKGGSIQEPAMGVGHILGFMPKAISERSMLSGFELDSIPGRIAKQLYPDADITVAGYETQFRPGSKDAIVTNVPFGQTAPVDPALDKALRKKLGSSYNLHNYFIIKGLLELRPGGVGAFITSAATMDGRNTKAREYISSLGVDLVGAIRLPNSTFKANAGTEVTADILFFRKRLPGESGNGIAFTSLTQVGTGKNKVQDKKGNDMLVDVPLLVNEYFAERPEMMLGEVMTAHDAGSGGLYGGDNLTLVARPGTELAAELADAIGRLPENVFEKGTVSGKPTVPGEATTQKDGTLSVKDEKVYVASKGELSEIASGTFKHNGKTRSYADATKDYQALKETLKELIQAEQSQAEDPVELRKQLNAQYDQFVEKYGRLNENKNLNVVMEEDPERFLPQALEKVVTVTNPTTGRRTKVVSKGDGILAKRVSQPMTEPTTAENLGDAIGISQAYRGRMDVGYIADMLGITTDEARERILAEREAYEDPVTGNLVDRDAYLSGNIREKLETARAAAENDSRYEQNVTDLEKSMPESIPFVDIFYKMGTPWIPEDVYEDFGREVCGIENMQISYAPVIDQFVVNKGYISDFTKAGNFATTRRNAMQLFEDAINLRKPVIMKTVTDSHGKEIQVRDEQATQEAIQAVMDMNDAFIQYIQEAKPLHARLTSIYNDRYNNYRLREYREPAFKGADGKVHYPNANPALTLRKHQVKAVQRSLQGSTLLAHQVGTGKTFTMITTAMEMRRLGLAKKPMIVVQNATLQDFASDFMKLYPSAKILVPNETERSASQRKRLFNLIATGDFDAIIVPQSFLAFIPDDEGRKKALIMARVDEIMAAADALQYTDKQLANKLKREAEALELSLSGEEKSSKKGGKRVKDQAKKQESALVRETQKLDRRTDDVLTFEQMGVDALFIDEAHNYKKIGFTTKMQNVKGVDTGYSERANSLYLKVSYVQEKNGGRNVILATGTPITNTMAEVWTMMRFVAPEILQDYGIRTFDEFAATFGQVEPSLEQNSTGGFKIADRFKSYVNVPELVKAFRSHADVVLTTDVEEFKESKNIPKLKDGRMTNHVIQKSDKLQDVMDVLIAALKEDEKKSGKEKTPGLPLVVFSKAKQAAIDLRLINPEYTDDPDSKTNRVVSEVMRIYKESTPDKGIQMIFCDSYQSPGSAPAIDLFDYDPSVPQFNLYRDIKNKLIEAGIPKEEIVIVSEITNADRKKAVFEKARAGAVRVLIGSTEKMGVGVNVQERMIALHHMDAPIRPMDFEQRNGRILRQGNMFAAMDKPVEVLTYGVEGTLDATAYERLRIKQDFINQMMKGDVSGRVMEESDDEDPSGKTFSQMAAELSGDKTLQLLFIAENKVKKLEGLRRSHEMKREQARVEAAMLKTDVVRLKNKLKDAEKVGEQVAKRFPEGVTKLTINGRPVTEKLSKVLAETLEDYEGRYALNRSVVFPVIELNDKAAKMVFGHTLGQLQYSLFMDKFQLVDEKPINTYAGVWLSLNSALANSGKRAEEIRQAIATSEARIKGAESIQEKEFDKMDELKERRQEVKDLKAELAKKAENASTPTGDVKLAKKNLKSSEKPVSLPEEMAGDSEESLDRMEQAMKPFEEVAVNAPEMVIAQSGSDILAAMPRVEPLQFAKVVTEANRPEVQAMYVPWTKQIIMLPKHGTVKEMRDKRWHESFHFALDMVLPQGDAGRLMLERAAGEVNKLAPTLSKWVEDTYGNRNTSEEKLVHMLEEVLSYMEDAGKVKSIRGGLDFGSQYPVLNEISNKVINYLTNNGHGKETDNYSGYDEGSEPTYRGEDQEGRNEEDFAGVRGISTEGREEIKLFLKNGTPVSILSGNEFEKKEGQTFVDQVSSFFESQGGKANSAFGEVLLDRKGVKNSKNHGMSRIKAVAFAAVKDVLENGMVALPMDYYGTGGKKQPTGIIVAPVEIDNKRYYCAVEVIQNTENNRLYVHEAFAEEKIPDSVAASQVHSEESASLQNQGEIAKVLQNILSDKNSDEIKLGLRGKPRRKAGESLIAYNRRLKEWQQEVEEAKKRRDVENMDVENPLDSELNDLAMEMMNHPTPIRKPGESDADFNARQQEWSEWYTNRMPEINRRMSEIKVQLENEKAAARSKEMKRTEEPLYTGEVPPQKDDEGQLSDEEMREVREIFQEKLADMKISVDKDQIKRDIKQEIIERRRYIETSNLEDTFFVDKVKKVAGSKEVLKAIPDYIEGTYTGEVSTELVEASKLVSDWFEEVYNLMAMEGVLYDAPQIQNYVTHIWDWKRTPKEAQERYANWVNTMRLRSPFTKHRVIPSYKEGIAMGMVPKYDDITGILLEYGHYATETIANKRMIEFLRNFKVMVPGGKDNLPMEMDIIVPDKVKDPMYSRMNHTALDGYKVLTQIKPMITPVFGDQRIIDPSHLTPLANKLIDGIWATSGLMKKIALSFSFFHHGALTETAIAMLGPARAGKVIAKNLIWDVITKGNIPALNDKEAARDAVKHLVSLGASNDYVTADVNNLTTSLHRFLKDKNVHVVKEAAYVLDFLNKGSDKFLWDTIHDGFKIASFAKMAKEIRAKAEREGWSQDELEKSLDEAGHLVNDTFGGLHFDILGFSPKSVRMMRALLLSPDWTLATIRQALSPLGFGKLYGNEGFWKTITGGENPVKMRKKYGRAFWVTAGIFFYALMNGLNAYFRAKDEDEEKKKADEMRKVDPSYKSPYELAYPDGMKWYDYTMLGNTLGHQTHLFTERYEDGTETYARWGKQFRELPELFFGRDGFSFPGPMIDKMSGKANPLLATTFEFISGHSLSGWENAQMKDKKGWERDVARLHMLAMKFVPYSMPTQEDKEWYWLDLIMPSSKGFSSGKAIGYFEKGIKSGDMDYIAAVYNACVMNGVNPEQSFNVAKARIEAETKRETLEDVETVQDAMRMFDEATDVKERKRLLRYIEQQTGAQDYQAISQEEMVQQAKDVINGNDVKVEASDYYLEHATGEDVMEDYRMKKTQAGLKKYHQDYTELMMENPSAGQRMLKEKRKFIEGYVMTSKYRNAINKVKKAMKDGRIEANKGMEEIRKIRREYFENLDKLEVK